MKKRCWFAVALLACACVLSAGYYGHAGWPAWVVLLAAGIALLVRGECRRPATASAGLAAALLAPTLWLLPWPIRVVPVLMLAGLILSILPIPRRWPARLGEALKDGGVILGCQAAVLQSYAVATGIAHELPGWLAGSVSAMARLLGIDAVYGGVNIDLFSMRKVHALAPTWDLLLDPIALCFLGGGIALLLLRCNAPWRQIGRLVLVVLVWLPVKAGLMMALLLHRALITDYDEPLRLMRQLWNYWLLAAFSAGPAWLAGRFVASRSAAAPAERAEPAQSYPQAGRALLLVAATGLAAFGLLWDPVGQRKGGRVLMDEYHTTWEPTQRPFDTNWYGHDAGYNYACIYDYCARFYDIARLTNRLDATALRDCDVLILKVPTSAYGADELEAIRGFVRRGGGVLAIGEHTDVFLTTSHLNQVGRMFGFEYRKDCAFGIDSSFEEVYTPPRVPHPIVQYFPLLEFEVSCSIQPRTVGGRAVIRGTGLWTLPSDYHASNFYPQVEDRPDARFGAFVQLWAKRCEAGRVVAFSDSTQFSNFSTFEPGKAELMIGMLEWLNHRNWGNEIAPRLLLLAGLVLGAGALTLRRRSLDPALILAAALCGWGVAGGLANLVHRAAMPFPKPLRPFVQVVIDRTVSEATVSKCGFIKASPQGFGIFEQWILRLGWFLSRREGDTVFDGADLIVVFQPTKRVTDDFRAKLVKFVEDGGRLCVLDSALNAKSTANSLLYPFDLSFDKESNIRGTLQGPDAWPQVPVESARRVKGGEPLACIGADVVGAQARHGKGMVTAVGFGARFNDESMGVTTDIEPSADLRRVFDLQFAMLREAMRQK